MKRLLLLMLTAGALMSASSASFAYGYYGHGYYGHGYYGPPAVVYAAPPQPQTYVEKPPAYAYYCQNPAGYYPQVPACPRGWMKVVAGPR